MNESESKNEKPKKERRFDPELLKRGLRCDLDQYDMLKRCSDTKDMTEWNEWRKENSDEDVLLEGADLELANLKGANLSIAHLKEASLRAALMEAASLVGSCLENALLINANLKEVNLGSAYLARANLMEADLRATDLLLAHLENAEFTMAKVNGSTLLWNCYVDHDTDFRGVGLDSVRIDAGTKQLLEYNNRRKNWEEWYKEHSRLKWLIKPFWWISDYGLRSWRIIVTFFGLAITFAVVYWLCPTFVMVNQVVGDIRNLWHSLYFSVVTMTTLGFGDIAANPDSWGGQTLLMLQVILGYVLLGALVTRFAVLFTVGGPAGTFSNEKKK